MRDAAGQGWAGVRSRPGRACLSALGIALGVATFVLVIAIPASGRADLDNRLRDLGTDVLKASPNAAATTGSDPNIVAQTLPPEAAALVRRIGPVTSAVSVGSVDGRVLRSEFSDTNDTAAVRVLATTPGLLDTVHAHVAQGRFLAAVDDHLPTAVLGADAASWLGMNRYDESMPPRILVGSRWFAVAGRLADTPLTPELSQAVFVSAQSAHRLLGYDNRPDTVYLRADETKLAAVAAVIPPTLNPSLPGLVSVSQPSAALAAKQATATTLSALFLGLAGVALLVGAIGVANTMIVSVMERRREIGMRRALGARRADIRRLFMFEALLLSAFGGVVGTGIGIGGALSYSLWRHWPPRLPLDTACSGIVGAAAIGMLAGLYPAFRASLVSPTTALATA